MVGIWDCIVLGLGGVGSAAACELARRGQRVLGIEQYGPAHDRGSSHGETRIIRKAYFEHPDYVPLLTRAFEKWRELEDVAGGRLLEQTGLFLSGPPGGEAIAGTLCAADEHKLPLDVLSPAESHKRFPDFRFSDDSLTLYEREAGYLHVEACVQTQLARSIAEGATLRFHERVAEWQATSQGVRVLSDRGVDEAGSLVIAAGAWASSLVRELVIPLRVLRKVQLWFPTDATAYRAAPCFYFEEPGGAFYGTPSPGRPLLKVAEHTGGEEIDDPATVDRTLRPADVDRVRTLVVQRLAAARPDPVRHSTCLYTMSPDGNFLLDRHPDHEHVWFAAGLSGHGFKLTGVIGEALADLATEGTTKLPVDFLRCDRFQPPDVQG